MRTTGTSKIGVQAGLRGAMASSIFASAGSRLALRRLQGTQASTQLIQLESPPRDRGKTWSMVSSLVPGFLPQY